MPSQLIQMAFLFLDYAFRLFRSDLVNEEKDRAVS